MKKRDRSGFAERLKLISKLIVNFCFFGAFLGGLLFAWWIAPDLSSISLGGEKFKNGEPAFDDAVFYARLILGLMFVAFLLTAITTFRRVLTGTDTYSYGASEVDD